MKKRNGERRGCGERGRYREIEIGVERGGRERGVNGRLWRDGQKRWQRRMNEREVDREKVLEGWIERERWVEREGWKER